MNTGIVRNQEVDFVAVKDTRTLYIQVAYMLTDDATAEREYASLEAIKGYAERYLVTLDDFPYPVRNSIRHLRPWELTEIL